MAYLTSIQSLAQIRDWDSLVSHGLGGSVFHESWFLRQVGVDRVLCIRDHGTLVCGLPLFASVDGCASNQSTRSVPYGGPIFAPASRGVRSAMVLRRAAMVAMADALQALFTRISFACSPALEDLVPWLRAGFVPEVRYTYIFDLERTAPEQFGPLMSRSRRRDLMLAERAAVQVLRDDALEHFDVGLAVRWSKEPTAADRTRSLLAEAIARSRGCSLVAMVNGRALGGVFVIWDAACAYTTHAYYHESAAHLGVSTRLYLEAMKLVASMSGVRQLDLEGSVLDGVEQYYQSLGARQSLYFGLHWARDPRALALSELYRYE